MSTAVPAINLDPGNLLAKRNAYRLVLTAALAPTAGARFQPAGFPEVGHVIYPAPRPDGSSGQVCIVDSAASMANHLESVCLAAPKFSTDLHPDLEGLPYVRLKVGDDFASSTTFSTSLTEAHRIASKTFLNKFTSLYANAKPESQPFKAILLQEFGLKDKGKKTVPDPGGFGAIFSTIFRRDPNSLVHGALFPDWGIKLPRLLTATQEAFGAARVASSGVSFSRSEEMRQAIFAVDEETAAEIRATFVLDLALLRSFRAGGAGLDDDQQSLVLRLALWKIGRLLAQPFRYRSNCDLQTMSVKVEGSGDAQVDPATLGSGIAGAIDRCYKSKGQGITELFRSAQSIETDADAEKNADDPDTGGDEDADEGD